MNINIYIPTYLLRFLNFQVLATGRPHKERKSLYRTYQVNTGRESQY